MVGYLYRFPFVSALCAVFCLIIVQSPAYGTSDLNEELFIAIRKSDVAAIKDLLARGADINASAGVVRIGVRNAIRRGDGHVVAALIAGGADLTAQAGDGSTFLHDAASSGHVHIVKALIAAGADVNASDRRGWTPLMRADAARRDEIVQALLAAGADPHATDKQGKNAARGGVERLIGSGVASVEGLLDTPLHTACAARDPEAVRRLVNAGANVNAKSRSGVTPVIAVFSVRRPVQGCDTLGEILEILLAAGAEVNADQTLGMLRSSLLHIAAEEHDHRAMRALLKAGVDVNRGDANFTPLETAAGTGDVEAIKLLLAAGADVNKARKDLLSRAGHWADLEGMEALIAAGADVNGSDTYGRKILHSVTRPAVVKMLVSAGTDVNAREEREGMTPLHTARDGSVVATLLAAGADPGIRDKRGRTALQNLCLQGHGDAAKALLAAGVDVNERDNQGFTALMITCGNRHSFHGRESKLRDIVQILLEAGSDLKATNGKGQTALQLAQAAGNHEVAALLSAYGQDDATGSGKPSTSRAEMQNSKELATKAVNVFGLDMYAKLDRREENLIFSPLSAFCPLAVGYEGAQGQTREEMANVLRINKANVPLPATLGVFARSFPDSVRKEGGELNLANGLWVQKGFDLAQEFGEKIRAESDVEIRQGDFQGSPGEAARDINSWVGEATRGKIPELVSPDTLRGQVMTIVNAVYFKSMWAMKFKKEATAQEDFFLGDGSRVKVPMMRHFSKEYQYLEEQTFQVIEMPYKGWAVSMVVFLPTKADGLAAFEKSLTLENLTGWLAKLSKWSPGVHVYFPRFEIRSRLPLVPALKGMGMGTAFDPQKADFSGLLQQKNGERARGLFATNVLQEALIEVNEEGTVAAAATSMIFTMGPSPEPKMFRADRPFLFLIRHKPSNCILFMGRVTRPQSGS